MFKPPFTKIVLFLTFSDIFTWGVYYSINALIGIYLSSKLGGNVVEYIGIGTGVYMLARAIFQLPVGYITDHIHKDRDEILLLIGSNVLMGLPFLLYPFIAGPGVYYILQFVFGTGTAINLVSWRKLFARNLDRHHEGSEYAIYETIMSVVTALFSIVAGVVGNISHEYFEAVIVVLGIIMMTGSIWPILVFTERNRNSAR